MVTNTEESANTSKGRIVPALHLYESSVILTSPPATTLAPNDNRTFCRNLR
jgi:hypothetical protein